jgi:Cof subfamily protein (haloacid dehalogenase superfamily)
MERIMARPPKIKLFLADVDGTLVTSQKLLTPRAIAAVAALRTAGVLFAITSGRPPRGMAHLIEPLRLDTPIASFNGGEMVDAGLNILDSRVLPEDVARETVEVLGEFKIDTWLYIDQDWLVRDPKAPHVEHEAQTVKFEPKVVSSFDNLLDKVVKIVGVSDDHALLARCEKEAKQRLGDRATAARSQPYYFDVTHRDANKGAVVDYLSEHFSIPREAIATIGDQPNDLMMFRRSGFSIAMGNAPDEVKSEASAVTDSCDDEGFAKAVERHVLEIAS